MGGKGSDGGDAGKITEQMAKQFYDQTQPIRERLIGNYMGFLGPTGEGATEGKWVPTYETQRVRNPEYTQGVGKDSYIVPGQPQFIDKRVQTGREWMPGSPGTEGDTTNPAYDVTRNPVFGYGRDMVNQQYEVARQNALANLPAGGGLNDAMTDIETARANQLGGLAANVSQDEYNKLYGLASGAPGQSMTVMSNLAGQQAAASAQQSAGKYGALGDLGMGAGMLFGSKPSKK